MTPTNKKTKQHGIEGSKPEQSNSTKELNSKAIVSMIDLVKYPVITEKSYIALYKNSQYTFDIDKRLTKTQIKKLFFSLFNVNVIAVNTHIPPRKQIRVGMAQGFRPTYKRAIITLEKGQSINYNLMADQKEAS
uniref:Large ribosomal subunit protein uL23c n=1 Tax=Chlamydomonas moewusii TaxID=3054 RepID=B2X2B5_CHLMO|nr:ribosomal protein L23 [Chlamydomonas moewusii]